MIIARELADKLAVELGEGWTVEDGYRVQDETMSDAWLRGPDGVSVHVTTAQYGLPVGRVAFDGTATDMRVREVMTHRRDEHGRRHITVGTARHVATMAKEIETRLLPNTRAYVEAGRAQVIKDDEYAADLRAFTSAMTAANPAFQVSPVHSRDSLPSNMIVGSYGDKVYGDMRINGTVQFDRLIMGRKTALMFAEWLAAHTRG